MESFPILKHLCFILQLIILLYNLEPTNILNCGFEFEVVFCNVKSKNLFAKFSFIILGPSGISSNEKLNTSFNDFECLRGNKNIP